MRLEPRHFQKGRPGERKMLLLISESEEESQLIDEYLGKKIPTDVTGKVDLSDGYGEHYICLEKKC